MRYHWLAVIDQMIGDDNKNAADRPVTPRPAHAGYQSAAGVMPSGERDGDPAKSMGTARTAALVCLSAVVMPYGDTNCMPEVDRCYWCILGVRKRHVDLGVSHNTFRSQVGHEHRASIASLAERIPQKPQQNRTFLKNVPKCVHMIESRLGTAQAVPRFGSIYVVRAPCRVRPLVSTSSRGPKSGVRMPDRDPRDA